MSNKYISNFTSFSEKMKASRVLKEKQEMSAKQEEYAKFFKKLLSDYGVTSPAELSDEKKSEFFDKINKGWDGELTDSGEKVMNESNDTDVFTVNEMCDLIIEMAKKYNEDSDESHTYESYITELLDKINEECGYKHK